MKKEVGIFYGKDKKGIYREFVAGGEHITVPVVNGCPMIGTKRFCLEFSDGLRIWGYVDEQPGLFVDLASMFARLSWRTGDIPDWPKPSDNERITKGG